MLKRLKLKENIAMVMILTLTCIILIMLPNPYYKDKENAVRCKGVILNVNNTEVSQYGMIKKGSQTVDLELISGKFKEKKVRAVNQLIGQLDRDKLFKKGDLALVVISLDNQNNIVFINPQAHYRIGQQVLLFSVFMAGLIIFGGWTGVRSLFSFVISALIIWRILVPCFLNGLPPVMVAFAAIVFMCGLIIFLVAGLNKKGITAFLGAISGVLTSCLLSIYFTAAFHLHGAIMPFAETLLYSGYGHLNMTRIYIAGVFICASGAVMDLGMDVAASMNELILKNPDMERKELFFSGLRISRAVVGTMTTTLLLAYSGGYITLLMAFMAQGIPVTNMLNLIYVAAEILKTLIGSIGLIMVGPFTALVGSFLLTKPDEIFMHNRKRLSVTKRWWRSLASGVSQNLSRFF